MTASEWFSVSLNAILTLTGAGRINDSGLAILLLSALSPLGRSSHYAQDSRNATCAHSCRNQGVSSIWIMEDTSYFSPCTNSRLILS